MEQGAGHAHTPHSARAGQGRSTPMAPADRRYVKHILTVLAGTIRANTAFCTVINELERNACEAGQPGRAEPTWP